LAIFQRAAEGYRDISSTFLENPTDAYATEKFAIGHLDLNGDGSSDLSIGGGYPAPDLDSPSTALGQNHLYLVNRGNGTGLLSRLSQPLPKSTKSLLAIDLDNDGDQDLVAANNNDFATLLINAREAPRPAELPRQTQGTNYLSSYLLSLA